MATSAARIPDIERQISVKENQISVLVGRNPGPVARGARLADQAPPPDVPAGLPSALLERRPDIREAEYAARAANAGIGVTVGGFLPRIGLSAILGGVSPQLNDITSRSAGLWSVGAQATGPLFQGGGLARPVRAGQGGLGGRKAPVPAGGAERLRRCRRRPGDPPEAGGGPRRSRSARSRAYGEAVKISTQRYAAGKASYFEVLQSQQLLFPAEAALAQTRRDQFIAVVQLYKALGGGWSLKDGDWAGAGRGR